MPEVSSATLEAIDAPDSMERAAAELAVLQTQAHVAPKPPSAFPAGTVGEVMKGASTVCEKIAKYGAELAEDNKKLEEATELLGGLATTFAKAATVMSTLSTVFAALGAVMGFLNAFLAPDPTAEIRKALQGLSDQMRSFRNYVEVELAELRQDVAIQPKLQTLNQARSRLEAIQVHLNEYQCLKAEKLEIPRTELVRCEDPLTLAQEIHDAWVATDGVNPNLLHLLYEKTYGEASRLAPMIYQNIAFMMTALRARTLRSCIDHENRTGKAPDQHQVLTYAQIASSEIAPLVATLATEGMAILQKCEKDLDVNYKLKLHSLFPRISVRAADEATHSLAALKICNALKGYPQYLWHVLVYKDVEAGQWNWPLNWHDGTFDGFFRQECKDGKACIVVVKSSLRGHVKYFLKDLQEHEWPLPQSVLHRFENMPGVVSPMPGAWLRGTDRLKFFERAIVRKEWRDACFYRMDLREWNAAVHSYASQVAGKHPGHKLLYLGIVKPELNPACDTTAMGKSGISMWCPLHVEHLGKDDDRKTPIRLICVAEHPQATD